MLIMLSTTWISSRHDLIKRCLLKANEKAAKKANEKGGTRNELLLFCACSSVAVVS
jgi:hypothetical protein